MIRTLWCLSIACLLLAGACGESPSPASPDPSETASTTTPASDAGPRSWPALVPPEKPGYKISVEGKNLPDTMYLAFHMGNKQFYSDTVLTKGNRKAVFAGEETLPGGIYLIVFPPDNRYIEVLVTNDQFFDVKVDMENLVENLEITGSRDNDLFYESQRYISSIGDQITPKQQQLTAMAEDAPGREALRTEIKDLNQKLMDHRYEFMEKYPNGFYTKVLYTMKDPEVPVNPDTSDKFFDYRYTRKHYWDEVDWRDSQLLRTPVLEGKINTYMQRLTVQHPDTLSRTAEGLLDLSRGNREVFRFVAITLLKKYGNSKIMGQDAVFATIVENAYATGEAYWLGEEDLQQLLDRAQAISPTLLGRQAPDFTMADTKGMAHTLSSVKGKYTVLFFWDYDCGHCKKVSPEVASLYNEKYHDKDVTLVTVSINGDLEVWKEKLGEYGFDKHGLNLQDHARATGFDDKYDLSSTPRLFILDKDKKILAKQIAYDQMEEILDRYLEE